MTDDDKLAVRLSFGCIALGFALFSGVIFVVAAAIKWVMA